LLGSTRTKAFALLLRRADTTLHAVWLTQAVQNVMGNAAKYTDPSGQVDIAVEHDDVEISVRDTAIGLAPTDPETVFLSYMRAAHAALRPRLAGSALACTSPKSSSTPTAARLMR